MLQSGFTIEDSAGFAKRMYGLLASGLSLESSDLLPEIEIPEEPEAIEEDDEVDDLDDDLDLDGEDEDEDVAEAGHVEL